MNAQPFDLASCPRVRTRQARATRAALRACARLPARWTVLLPPLGEATMSFIGIDPDAAGGEAIDLAVSFGTERGRVTIEPAFAVRLVDAVLAGAAIFSPARSAGPAERGVLAGVLAPALDRLGGSVSLDPVAARDGHTAALAFLLETVVASGWLRLTPPAGDWPGLADAADAWRGRAGRVPVTADVQLATTGLPARGFTGIAVGDAIVFDGMPAASFGADVPWNGCLRVGDHVAEIVVDADGKVSLVGGFSPARPARKEERHMSASGSNTDSTTVLSAASIEVVAELGRIALRGDELLGLAPGAVLALGAQRKGVSLRVGGEIWADGEIVDIDGELGVRVTRIANR